MFTPKRLGGFLLFAVMLVALPMRFQRAAAGYEHVKRVNDSYFRDLRSGAPADYLARRYAGVIYPLHEGIVEIVQGQIPRLREAQIHPFAHWQPWLARRGIPFTAPPVQLHGIAWNGASWAADGMDPYLVFALGQPRSIRAVQVRCILDNGKGTAGLVQLFWWRSGSNQASATERNATLLAQPSAREQSFLFWINDTIDHFRLDLDLPECELALKEITLFEAEP